MEEENFELLSVEERLSHKVGGTFCQHQGEEGRSRPGWDGARVGWDKWDSGLTLRGTGALRGTGWG
jgi:hypothetical protein